MRNRRILAFVSIVFVAIVAALWFHPHRETSPLTDHASDAPVVPVIGAQMGGISQDLTVAGIFQPFQDIDVHGKVSGYIKKIFVDIGDRVHAGQTLAILEVPELEAQVEGARASIAQSQEDIARLKSEMAREEANYSAVHANFTRLAEASKQQPGLVAEQELDDAKAKDRSAESGVAAAKSAIAAAEGKLGVSRADQLRVSSLVQYATITAPFSGVVTMRYADTGSLIPAGTSESNAQAVIRLAQSDLLRLRMPVPEQDVPLIDLGSQVLVDVQATGQQFSGKIVRFTRDVSNATRTMLCEVDVPNPKLILTPGMYANVTFHLRQQRETLIVPSAAVVQGDHPYVFLVGAGNTIERRQVTLGITSANEQAITSGLQAGDRIVVGDLATLQPGQQVQPKPAAQDLLTYHADKSKGGK